MKLKTIAIWTLPAATLLAHADELQPAIPTSASMGASVPYIRYEAENASLTGSASIVGPNRSIGDLGGEASGREAVKLSRSGDGIIWRATADANSMVVRYCIPDSEDGKGLDATISVYLNGRKRDVINLTSRYAWLYGPEENPGNIPQLGSPRHIYDESHKLFAFVIKKGDEVMLEKDVGDTAPYYGIDFVELELVPPPLPCPEGFVNIADEGITSDNFDAKFPALLQAMGWQERFKGKRGVYIPPGQYLMQSIAMIHKPTSGIEIRGAGMWHTVLFDYRGKEADWGTPGFNLNGVTAHFSDFAIFGGNNARTGSGKPFVNSYGNGTTMKNIWVEHMTCGFWVGGGSGITDKLSIDGCRLRNLGADGINLCNGTSNSIITNTTVRCSGDDGIAIWSAPEMDGPKDAGHPGCTNNLVINCTVELPWRANGFAIYGGRDNTIRNCIVRDTLTYAGVNISSTFKPRPFGGQTLVDHVLIERCGGTFWSGQQFGALWVMADASPVTHVVFKDVDIRDATYSGIMLKSETYNKSVVQKMQADFKNVTVNGTGTCGILVQDALGSASFHNLSLTNIAGPPLQRKKDTNGKKGTGTIDLHFDGPPLNQKL